MSSPPLSDGSGWHEMVSSRNHPIHNFPVNNKRAHSDEVRTPFYGAWLCPDIWAIAKYYYYRYSDWDSKSSQNLISKSKWVEVNTLCFCNYFSCHTFLFFIQHISNLLFGFSHLDHFGCVEDVKWYTFYSVQIIPKCFSYDHEITSSIFFDNYYQMIQGNRCYIFPLSTIAMYMTV